jgi:uncharacterized protein YbaR (Trm112 family)
MNMNMNMNTRTFDMGILEIVRCPVSKQKLTYVESSTPHLRAVFDLPASPDEPIQAPETPGIKTLFADYPIVDGIAILDPSRASVSTYADHTTTNPAGV